MGAKVHIVNHTTRPLKLKVGNQLVFTDLVTLEQDAEYKMSVDCGATFREYLLGVDTCGKLLVVNAHECEDARSIIVKEVDGTFDVQMEFRSARRTCPGNKLMNRGKLLWIKFWQ